SYRVFTSRCVRFNSCAMARSDSFSKIRASRIRWLVSE
ncbi:hypothetical protein AJOOGB_AJOOGB_13205, partial [Dysosmobacter welbionis]